MQSPGGRSREGGQWKRHSLSLSHFSFRNSDLASPQHVCEQGIASFLAERGVIKKSCSEGHPTLLPILSFGGEGLSAAQASQQHHVFKLCALVQNLGLPSGFLPWCGRKKKGKKHLCSPLAFTSLPLLKSKEQALSKPFMLFSVLESKLCSERFFICDLLWFLNSCSIFSCTSHHTSHTGQLLLWG